MILMTELVCHPVQGQDALTKAIRVTCILVLVLLSAAFPVVATPPQKSGSAESVFQKVASSVVVVLVRNAQGKAVAQGSGVVIGAGQVITNCHVTKEGQDIEVHSGKKKLVATVRFNDPDHDLCQLSVPGLTAPSVTVGTTKALKVGQQVFAVGAPEGLDLTLSEGIISALRHFDDSVLIQTTAPISPGSSGGGLFDSHGRLVGITSYKMKEGENLNFALPAGWIGTLARYSVTKHRAESVRSEQNLPFIFSVAALLTKNDAAGLERLCLARTLSHPRDGMAWFFLGFAYDRLGQHKRASEAYRSVRQIQITDDSPWVILGIALEGNKRYAFASVIYRQALRFNPADEVAWSCLGDAYEHNRKYSEAVKAFKKALRLRPEDEFAWVGLGIARDDLGENAEGVEAFRQALQVNHDDELAESAWADLGATFETLGQYDKAIKAEREALRIKPDDEGAWVSLSVAYLNLRAYPQAAEAYTEATRLKPDDWQAWFGLGAAYGNLGQYGKAAQAFRQVVRLKPKNASAWFFLGNTYCLQNNRAAALPVYQVLQKLDTGMARKLFDTCIVP